MSSYEKIKAVYKEEISASYRKKLTVSYICERAEVSRKTFYSNFADLDDVFVRIVEDDLMSATKSLGTMLAGCKSAPLIVCEHLFRLIYDRRDFFTNAFYALGTEKFRAALTTEMCAINSAMVSPAENIGSTEKGYIAEFFASCFSSAVVIWIQNKMNIPPQSLAENYEKWVNLDWRKFGVMIQV